MSEVPKWVVCVRLAMSASLSRSRRPSAEGRWLHRGGRRAATNGPLSPVHALECERREGPLSIPASCPYPAACEASGDVSPTAATGGGVLRRGLALGLVALAALVFAVPSEAQNTAPTGKPTIDGTPHLGEILTTSVSGIADADGLTTPGYTYQWLRVLRQGGGTSNIAGATASTYTLTGGDVEHRVQVRVMFTDDGGNAETATSDIYPSSGTVLSVPSAPRRFLATAGDGRVRLKWTNSSNFGGVDVTTLRYQSRYAPGATVPDGTAWSNPTKFVQHRQLFAGLTNGTAYAFEVRAVNAVGSGPPVTATATPMTVACPAPSLGNRRQHWRGDLTIDAATPHNGDTRKFFGFATEDGLDGDLPEGSLSDTDFTLGAQAYSIDAAVVGDVLASTLPGYVLFGFDRDLTEAHNAALRLHVCGTAHDFSDALGPDFIHTYAWPADLDWEVLPSRTLYLSLPPNNAATGTPAVSGTAQTAEVLTAATGTIADADGLTLADAAEAGFAYTYQWLRVDSDGTSNPTDIPGATGARYTVTAADMGKKLKVRVSFTDDFNANEARTSDAYPSSGTVSRGKVVVGFRGVSVAEGVLGQLSFPEDVGTAVLTAYLDRSLETALSVPWFTSDQTAVSPDDYTGGPGTLTFAPGEIEQTIALPIVDDAIREDPVLGLDESLLVALEFGDDYRLKNSGVVEVLILDNDGDDAVANSFPTASDGRVTALENQDYTFTAADFNYADSNADPLASVTIKLLPASGTLKLDNANVRQDATVTKAQLDAGSFKYTPPPDQTGTGVAFFLFAVSDGEAESTSVYRMTIDIAEATSAPGRPRNLTAVPGSGAVALNWEAPLRPRLLRDRPLRGPPRRGRGGAGGHGLGVRRAHLHAHGHRLGERAAPHVRGAGGERLDSG